MCVVNWQAISAMGTLLAVLVALFGTAFRAKFFPPKLRLRLLSSEGELTTAVLQWMDNVGEIVGRQVPARYYHVCVSNARRWSPAEQVQVILLGVEEPAADGRMLPIWTGDVPLGWRHRELFPAARTIGPEASVDICSVIKGKSLQLHPLITPNNLDVVRKVATTFVITIQARGAEADSAPLRLKINWDGLWNDGTQEMRRHLTIAMDQTGG
jgi:hypothetical protein